MIGDYNHVKADRLVNAEVQLQNRMWGPSHGRVDSHNGELARASMAQLEALYRKQNGHADAFLRPHGIYPETWSGFRDYGSDIANLVVAAAFLHQEIARKLRLDEDTTRSKRNPETKPYVGDKPKDV